MQRSSIRRFLSTAVVAAILVGISPQPLSAAPTARLRGRVTGMDGVTPLAGVTVTLYDAGKKTTFSSSPTDARGTFDSSVPPGTYGVVAETSRGAYLASGAVKLGEGTNPPVVLTLKADPPPTEGEPPTEGGGGTSGPKKNDLKPWAKWTIVGGLVVAGILVIDAVTSDENPASGF